MTLNSADGSALNETLSPEFIASQGLTDEEYSKVVEILGRTPNKVELGIFATMWSEHCSYKSTKIHLNKLPTKAPWVIQGPGENAGVIDIGDGQAAVFKIESHNHPSFIEPYQGAATGVGGIVRDVFTMGARPVALMNALRFGDPSHPRTRNLLSGVVAGIGGYGNAVGVPTLGGEVNFDSAFNGNILVNAFCLGLADKNRIFYSSAAGIGNPLVYLGAKTGRDGIHGATMASAAFGEDSQAKRPTVQVGDPFKEKLLIEACLELMQSDSIVAIQDMGAAGLTSSSFEMASKGEVGVKLWLDKVPAREEGMTPYELMLSESQERMLMVLRPGAESMAEALFQKWELDYAIIGEITTSRRMELFWNGDLVGDLPIDPLAKASPELNRPYTFQKKHGIFEHQRLSSRNVQACLDDMPDILGSYDLASRRPVFEQYDSQVQGWTLEGPGGSAGIISVPGGAKALAMTVDCTPRYCALDAREGARQAVAEAYRNLSAVGARPLALSNNLNFASPENPRIMGQIVAAVEGLAEAAEVLLMPVVSGNVSLYNESDEGPILPTPVIAAVGLLDQRQRHARLSGAREGMQLFLLGDPGVGWLGGSFYLERRDRRHQAAPPPVNLAKEKLTGETLRLIISHGLCTAAQDIADGGMLVALAEMALASEVGMALSLDGLAGYNPENAAPCLFGEDQGRYILAIEEKAAKAAQTLASEKGITLTRLGCCRPQAEYPQLTIGPSASISLEKLARAHKSGLEAYLDE